MLHHAINITSIEVELFAIRCKINQAVQIPGSSHIIIITDAIHMAQKNFDSSTHLYQLQLITISKDLQAFFNNYSGNSMEFWDCPSKKNGTSMHQWIRKWKKFNLIPLYSCKISWDFKKRRSVTTSLKSGVQL